MVRHQLFLVNFKALTPKYNKMPLLSPLPNDLAEFSRAQLANNNTTKPHNLIFLKANLKTF
jgi:hypothetical protein